MDFCTLVAVEFSPIKSLQTLCLGLCPCHEHRWRRMEEVSTAADHLWDFPNSKAFSPSCFSRIFYRRGAELGKRWACRTDTMLPFEYNWLANSGKSYWMWKDALLIKRISFCSCSLARSNVITTKIQHKFKRVGLFAGRKVDLHLFLKKFFILSFNLTQNLWCCLIWLWTCDPQT